MRRFIRIATVIGVLMLVAGSQSASRGDAAGPPPEPGRQGPGGGPRPGGPPMFHVPPPEILELLKLSDAQWARIEQIRDEAVRATARTEADLQIAELDLRRAADTDTPDHATIDDAVERVAALRTTLFKERVASWLRFRRVLTPAQRTQLRSLRPPRPPR